MGLDIDVGLLSKLRNRRMPVSENKMNTIWSLQVSLAAGTITKFLLREQHGGSVRQLFPSLLLVLDLNSSRAYHLSLESLSLSLCKTKDLQGRIDTCKMHHLGIEPRTSAWKADILPLN